MTGLRLLNVLKHSFENSLTNTSPQIPQPKLITTPLRPHQRAVVAEMARRERASSTGLHQDGSHTYADYGILGDDVGSGKSLVILA